VRVNSEAILPEVSAEMENSAARVGSFSLSRAPKRNGK
jgi:hypothetical protein